MPKQTKTQERSIAPRGDRALAVQSAALVRRGLLDLARESNWVVKKLFTQRIPDLSISPTGQVCLTSHDLRAGRPRISVFDAELAAPAFNFDVPWTDLPPRTLSDCDSPTAFSWSPCGRYVAGSCPDWPRQIHFFDAQRKSYVRSLELLSHLPASLAWSPSGRHFAASYPGGSQAAIHLWLAHTGHIPEGAPAAKHAGIPSFLSTAEDGVGDEGTFQGYGSIAFSPDEKCLAAVIKFEEEWADDCIMIASVPSLESIAVIHASGTVTDVGWTPDNRQLVFCAAGQTYLQMIASIWSEDPLALPFGAEICRSHPTLRVVAGFCSWLKSSAKGRLFLADLSEGTILDECPAEGVVDVRWSTDGLKLYAVMQDGLAYIYDHPLI